MAGAALGGAVAAASRIGHLATAAAASFAVSARPVAFVSGGRTGGPAGARAQRPLGARLRAFRDEWQGGLALALRGRVLRGPLLFGLVTSIGERAS